MKIFNQLIAEYDAQVEGHTARWTIGDTDFVHTGERIYTEVDHKLVGPGKNAKTLRSVVKFIEAIG